MAGSKPDRAAGAISKLLILLIGRVPFTPNDSPGAVAKAVVRGGLPAQSKRGRMIHDPLFPRLDLDVCLSTL
jgi:hypothetical protein